MGVEPLSAPGAHEGWAWRVLARFDRVLDVATISLLVSMIVIVFTQVITRKLFSYVFVWSEEVTLLCLTWFSFIGIAIGFREESHLAMDVISSVLPEKVNYVLDRIIDLTVFAFGLYLVFFGWKFTVRMAESTLPATGLPNSLQYVVMPFTGVLTCLYSALQFFGVDTRRFQHIDEEIKRNA
jgi:TRAP-type C4-dicarboxylate transport system permease small subunit